jgi:bla regulator protein BlaR1
MSASLMHALIGTTVASSVAILLIGLLRRPLRVAVGARAAYWLWLLVPASGLAVLLPAPSTTLRMVSGTLPNYMSSALNSVATTATTPGRSPTFVIVLLTIWASGSALMFILLLGRQIAFVRSLGKMTPDPNGIRRSSTTVAPMLVAAWRPHVVLPVDFETRYDNEEQQLVLSHERAHLLRRDLWTNAFAAGCLCLFWFNPLMYWAIGRLRLDQELACDALVLARLGTAPRRYAGALLKTQLATESVWHTPVGCYWLSSHPLTERIAMLKRPLPGLSRRLGGIAFTIALSMSAGYATWATQPEPKIESASILVSMKVTVTNPPSAYKWSAGTEYLVNSGEPAPYPPQHPYDVRCRAFLPDGNGRSSVWDDEKARGIPLPVTGQILLECTISNDGGVVSTPSVIAVDGEPATTEVDDPEHMHHYRLELYATTSKEKIAAAKVAAAVRH